MIYGENNSSEENGLQKKSVVTARTQQSETENKTSRLTEKPYESMSIEQLVNELEKHIRAHEPRLIKNRVDKIRDVVKRKINQDRIKKETDFIETGGEKKDFSYYNANYRRFNALIGDFKVNLHSKYKAIEREQKENLKIRWEIIEQLKTLYLNPATDYRQIFKKFKTLKEKWNGTGDIPKGQISNVFNTYRHHLHNYYQYLKLNRNLEALEYGHNLEIKEKLIRKAKMITQETSMRKAKNDLQFLHRKWKETGPIAKEIKEEKWQEFKHASTMVHHHINELVKRFHLQKTENKEQKQSVLKQMKSLLVEQSETEKQWRDKIKQMEELSDAFLKIGSTLKKENVLLWNQYKSIVHDFNHRKNSFYRSLRKDSEKYKEEKRKLLDKAIQLKDSTQWYRASKEFMELQMQWKKMGGSSRKMSDKLWREFKATCDCFFERYNANKQEQKQELYQNYENKKAFVKQIKETTLPVDQQQALEQIKEYCEQWKKMGNIPEKEEKINDDFNRLINNSLDTLNFPKQELEQIKLNNLIEQITIDNNHYLLQENIHRARRKMQDLKREISQMENNIGFFSAAKRDSPLLENTMKSIADLKDQHLLWSKRYKRLVNLDLSD